MWTGEQGVPNVPIFFRSLFIKYHQLYIDENKSHTNFHDFIMKIEEVPPLLSFSCFQKVEQLFLEVKMEENVFLAMTFYSEVQSTSSFHCCAGFDEIFDRTPIMIMMSHIKWWGQMAQNGSKWPLWANLGHLAQPQLCETMVIMGVPSKISLKPAQQ